VRLHWLGRRASRETRFKVSVTKTLRMTKSRNYIVGVVDDDPRVLESLAGLLDAAGYTARVFASARTFLESDGPSQIDCLISDIGMPDMDGFALQRLTNAARPELPVIWITGRDGPTKQRLAGLDHADARVFFKPFDAAELLAAVALAVKGR
jgi:FixJ family two-component response regulator